MQPSIVCRSRTFASRSHRFTTSLQSRNDFIRRITPSLDCEPESLSRPRIPQPDTESYFESQYPPTAQVLRTCRGLLRAYTREKGSYPNRVRHYCAYILEVERRHLRCVAMAYNRGGNPDALPPYVYPDFLLTASFEVLEVLETILRIFR